MTNNQGPKSSAVVARQTELAYRYRLQGFTLQAIADKLNEEEQGWNVSVPTIQRRLAKGLKERYAPLAEEYLAMELDKLDLMETHLQPLVESGDTAAINSKLRIMERRAKYLGLDAPEKVELKFKAHDPEVDELLSMYSNDSSDVVIIEGTLA